jgi:hypothetical protein
MTTETYEMFSVEVGDTIIIAGSMYAVASIEPDDNGYILRLTDEEGYAKMISAGEFDKVRVVVPDID